MDCLQVLQMTKRQVMANNLDSLYKELKGLVRIADYTGNRPAQLAASIREKLPKRLDSSDQLQINARVLLAEVWDYYGNFDAAKEVSLPAPQILDLKKIPQIPLKKKDALTKSKIRLRVAYARSLYRAPERTAVINILLDCREYVQNYLASEDFPCYGTLGEIAYTLGRTYRQRQRFDEALREFTEAIRLYYDT